MTAGRLAAALALAVGIGVLAAHPAASAETGRISDVSVTDGRLTVVFQADGLPEGVTVDPASVVVQVAGQEVTPTVDRVSDDTTTVTRTAVLAIDNSRSMAGARLDAAKDAARTFLDTVPDDVSVGLVTIGDTAELAVPTTSDRDLVRAAIDGLALDDTVGTALFDGAVLAADQTGDEGSRSVLLITDGNEDGSSSATVDEAIGHATDDGVIVDAVYISENPLQPPELQELVTGAGGQVVTSAEADLASVLEQFAEAISTQLLIGTELPDGLPRSGNVAVSALAGEVPIRDTAFTTLTDAGQPAPPPADYGPRAVEPTAAPSLLGASALPFLLAALFVGLVVLAYVTFGSLRRDEKHGRVRRRLSVYTLTGRPTSRHERTSTALGTSQVARSAVELAGKVVQKRDFETGLELKLEAAGVPLRAAEWMIIHVGAAIGGAILLLLVSGGQLVAAFLGLAIGLGIPFAYLVVKASRRTSAFLAQLPDTLQMVAGSLSAGYSIPQSMDSVVREGSQPISGEFNRALVEARLGVPIEDAMEGVAERMQSKDFAWVVMAIRIQREVGGNLAELLTTVAATLRERERLRRQVQVLSAEGRLSAWILGLLPLVFTTYLVMVQPNYLRPLVSDTLGWFLIGMGVTLLAIGTVWMSRVVKVEV